MSCMVESLDFGVGCGYPCTHRQISFSLTCVFPVVTKEQRAGWEAYAAEHHQWLDRAYVSELQQTARQDAYFNITQKQQPQQRRALDVEYDWMAKDILLDQHDSDHHNEDDPHRSLQDQHSYIPFVWQIPEGRESPAAPDDGPFLIYWQTSPVFPLKAILNFDLLSHPAIAAGCHAALATGRGVLGAATNLNVKIEGYMNDETEKYTQFNLLHGQYRDEVDTFKGMPLTPLQYPVFDGFGLDRQVAGLVATNVSTLEKAGEGDTSMFLRTWQPN